MKNIIEINPIDPLWSLDYIYIIRRAIEEEAYILMWTRLHIMALRSQINRIKKDKKSKHGSLLGGYEPFTVALKNGKYAAFIGKKEDEDPFADLLELYAPKVNTVKDYLRLIAKEGFIIVKDRMNGHRIMREYKKKIGFKGKGGYFEMKEFKNGRFFFKVTK